MTRIVRHRAIVLLGLLPLSLAYGCSLLVDVGDLTSSDAGDAHAGPAKDAHDVDASSDAPFGSGDDGAVDGTASTGDASSGDTSIADTGAIDSSGRDASEGGLLNCANDLSNVGTGDFHIAFGVIMTQSALTPLLNQRSACSPAVFWDVRANGGALQIEIDDVSHFNSFTTSGVALNDGAVHVVIVQRVSGIPSVQIDGTSQGSVGSNAALTALPPLATGTDVCVGQDGTVAFTGTISGVCVTNH